MSFFRISIISAKLYPVEDTNLVLSYSPMDISDCRLLPRLHNLVGDNIQGRSEIGFQDFQKPFILNCATPISYKKTVLF